MAEQNLTTWYKSTEQKPLAVATIIVIYGGTAYAGVYSPADDRVIRYPEDFVPVPLDGCERWCYLPI